MLKVTSDKGKVVERYAYDPWGLRRNPTKWHEPETQKSFLFDRGYTLHEHLDDFGLVNMNGRVYDPLLAQFLSPDPYIQAPGNWLNYNRYAYGFNNPLMFADPDGEWIMAVVIGAFINTAIQGVTGNIHSGGDFFKAMAIGGVSGLAGYGAGQLVTSAVGTVGFAGGAMTGAAGGFAGGFVGGAGNAWAGGATLGQGLEQGLIGGGFGVVTGGLIGGISGGITATKYGGDFWSGKGAVFESLAATGLTPEDVKVGEGMEYTTKYANGVADDTYGKLSYVKRIATNEVPVGEGYTLKNGCIINKDGGIANGLTKYLGKGNSEVYLGKSAFISVNQLKLTIGHEYIHATHFNMGYPQGRIFRNINEEYRGVPWTEISVYNWEANMGVNNGYRSWNGMLGIWSWSRQPYFNWLINANF